MKVIVYFASLAVLVIASAVAECWHQFWSQLRQCNDREP